MIRLIEITATICLIFFNENRATVWDGITPWYTGSKCNCNGYSNRCFFDQTLYDTTGHGGHCLDCSANRDGANCEKCRSNFYMRQDGFCINCQCDPVGSRSLQCNSQGKCACKPGVGGDKCNRCDADFYGFTSAGCKSCGCSVAGTGEGSCDSYNGRCFCKEYVEGRKCEECKPGYFNLNPNNKFGCTPCFCYGHSSQCKSAQGFTKFTLESNFVKNNEKWSATTQFNEKINVKYEIFSRSISVQSVNNEAVYFVAPERFLGNQKGCYDQNLEFYLSIKDDDYTPSASDVILEGNGAVITTSIIAQGNPLPNNQYQLYTFRLNEHSEFGWQPRLTSRSFISLLTNLTSLRIKATYNYKGVGFLQNFKLNTANRGIGPPATWIETCDCPTGYVGQFCESCAPGYRHYPASGGAFSPCIPCDCNNHASICDAENGRCICQDNTAGENCEFCARGYYGNALAGTVQDCKPCNCPNGGPCIQLDEFIVVCTECPQGYTGHRCDSCSDGYYGDPSGKFGKIEPCQACQCNQNVDPNAIGNCNTTTGECLKCIYNTGGRNCQSCLPGYYGNALVLPKGDCKICNCNPAGSAHDFGTTLCDQTTGSCVCKPHVTGKNCDKCENGFYNLHSNFGCQPCRCNPIGSLNKTCDVYTGQCYCQPGVTGLRCDRCEAKKYGFSSTGCRSCDCDPAGSVHMQCDATGRCSCLENVEGEKCDRCKENKYNKNIGCIDCPECYNLLKESNEIHKSKLKSLQEVFEEIERAPTVINEEEFPRELGKAQGKINDLYRSVQEEKLQEKVSLIKNKQKEINHILSDVVQNIFTLKEKVSIANANLEHADDVVFEAENKIKEIDEMYRLDGEPALENAWKKAKILGQQSVKMTQIAQESRDVADELDRKAEGIAEVCGKAKNISVESYEKVKSANLKQLRLRDEIMKIKTDLIDTEHKMNKTKEWTEQVKNKVTKTKNEATDLLSEIKNFNVPTFNVDEFRKKNDDLRVKAYDLRDKSNQLFKDSAGLRQDVEEKTKLGKELLKKAKDQQDEIEDLRNDLVLSESQAKAAIDLWNEVLQGAQINHKLLTEFDTQTQKNRLQAQAAIETIEEIEEIINKTIAETKIANDDLIEARRNIDLALEKAQQANNLANDASNNAKQVKSDALNLFKNTTALSEEADLMFDRVQSTEGQLKLLLVKTRSNESLLNEAAEKVGRAGKDTEEVSKKIRDLLFDVQEIMNELQNSPDIDEKEIERLEESIRRTEQRLRETKLEETLERLQEEHKLRNELIAQYKLQISILQKEVENVEEIVNALPDGCFKRVELEP